jgi:hypothetical protein
MICLRCREKKRKLPGNGEYKAVTVNSRPTMSIETALPDELALDFDL